MKLKGNEWAGILLVFLGVLALKQSGCDFDIPDINPEPEDRIIQIENPAVLVIEQENDRSTLTQDQLNVVLGIDWVDHAERKNAEVRILDADTEFTQESAWRLAFYRERASIPWIIISTDKGNFEGPLPATVQETITLLDKYL